MDLVMPLAMRSRVGGSCTSELADGIKTETFVQAMWRCANWRGHLTCQLKHEVLHLELLSRLFDRIDSAELVVWIEYEPSGQYARRIGFEYEWLTGRQLAVNASMAGPYVVMVDERKLVAASPYRSTPKRLWRVRDNLPGTPAFGPLVRTTSELAAAAAVDIRGLLDALALEFGETSALCKFTRWPTATGVFTAFG
jgi:hypothetical protein